MFRSSLDRLPRLPMHLGIAMKSLLLHSYAALALACLALPGTDASARRGTAVPASAHELRAQDGPFARAEAAYREKSYARAHDLYAAALKGELTPDQRAWGEFRL